MGRYEGISVMGIQRIVSNTYNLYMVIWFCLQLKSEYPLKPAQKISPFHCENKNNSLYVCPLVLLC